MSGDLVLFGRKLKVMGAKDEGSEKYLRGKTVAWAYGDELTLMPKSFFDQLLTRMSPTGARFYGTTNPDSPFHYIAEDWVFNQERLATGLIKDIHFGLDDNPHLSKEFKDFLKKSHSGVFYKRYIDGLWVVAEGSIYRDCFSDENLYDDTTAPYQLRDIGHRRFIGVDYGTANPQVYLDCIDDGKTVWVDNEYYWDSIKEGKQKTDKEYVDDLIQFIGRYQDAIVVVDPSAASFQAECRSRGIPATDVEIEGADNEVLPGIRAVSTAFARKMIKIHKNKCPNTIAEVQTYAWDEKRCARGDEKPLKVKDHCPDALRYVVKTEIPEWRLLYS
jgi:PBSX family phage terminase large subunit